MKKKMKQEKGDTWSIRLREIVPLQKVAREGHFYLGVIEPNTGNGRVMRILEEEDCRRRESKWKDPRWSMAVMFKEAELTAGGRMAAGDEFRDAVNEVLIKIKPKDWLFF